MPILPAYPQEGQPIRAAWGRRVVDFLKNLPITGGPGIRVSRSNNGITLSLARPGKGSAQAKYPLQPLIGSTPVKVKFRYGTVHGIVPMIGGDPLTPALADSPELTITGAGVIYAKVGLAPDTYEAENPVLEFVAGDESNIPDDVARVSAHELLVGVAWDAEAGAITDLAPTHTGSIDVASCGGVVNHWTLGN